MQYPQAPIPVGYVDGSLDDVNDRLQELGNDWRDTAFEHCALGNAEGVRGALASGWKCTVPDKRGSSALHW